MIEPSINDRVNERLDDPIDVALNARPCVEALQGVLRLHRTRLVSNRFTNPGEYAPHRIVKSQPYLAEAGTTRLARFEGKAAKR